ncbi:MAG: hypothetical protein WD491_12475, partial [Balneolales bacterium]
DDELAFIKAFRELMRLKNVLSTFTDFTFDDLSMDEQRFEDYKSKYLDLYDKTKKETAKQKVSILQDVDFELELIHRDEINVKYIMNLLEALKDAAPEDQARQRKAIVELMAGDAELRSKRELIEKFIAENLPAIADSADVADEFDSFWSEQRKLAFDALSAEEGLDAARLEEVIGEYLFTEKPPLRDDVIGMMNERPALKQRARAAERITRRMRGFVETFVSGVAG